MSDSTFHVFVSGRVQGVGYRRYAQKSAQKWKLMGWARNLLDGRVEIKVTGSKDFIDQFLEDLRKGPPFSQVRDVVAHMLVGKEDFAEFSIEPDQEIR